MKSCRQILLWMMLIAAVAQFSHFSVGQNQKVQRKPGEVGLDSIINSPNPQSTIAVSVTEEEVEDEVMLITVTSKTFTPPDLLKFRPFQAEGTHVDIWSNPDGFANLRPKDLSEEIQVQSKYVAESAGNYPLAAEGNLGVAGGGAGGVVNKVHWSAKVGNANVGALILTDKNSGREELDSTNTDTDTPTLLLGTADEDGKGDVEFRLLTTTGTFNWAIHQGSMSVASGTLASATWQDEKLNLDPGAYTLAVLDPGDPNFKRTINFTVVRVSFDPDPIKTGFTKPLALNQA